MFTGYAVGAPLKMHVLHRDEVVIGKTLHPLHAHVTQSLVPQLTDSVKSNVHFFRAFIRYNVLTLRTRATIRHPLLNFIMLFQVLPV